MPQRRAAKKDLRQNKKRQKRNLTAKQKMKTIIKNFKKSIANVDIDTETKAKALREVYMTLDKAAAKNIIHKNKASRKKSQFSKLLAKPAK